MSKWTQTGMRFHFGWKFHFGVQSALYLCSHELRRNETQNGMDFISVILTEMKFQTGMRFLCEHNLPQTKWISADLLDVAFNAHVRLKLNTGMDFISVILTEMKFHVSRTCFRAGLKYQTGMSSFRLSCERTLSFLRLLTADFITLLLSLYLKAINIRNILSDLGAFYQRDHLPLLLEGYSHFKEIFYSPLWESLVKEIHFAFVKAC